MIQRDVIGIAGLAVECFVAGSGRPLAEASDVIMECDDLIMHLIRRSADTVPKGAG